MAKRRGTRGISWSRRVGGRGEDTINVLYFDIRKDQNFYFRIILQKLQQTIFSSSLQCLLNKKLRERF